MNEIIANLFEVTNQFYKDVLAWGNFLPDL